MAKIYTDFELKNLQFLLFKYGAKVQTLEKLAILKEKKIETFLVIFKLCEQGRFNMPQILACPPDRVEKGSSEQRQS